MISEHSVTCAEEKQYSGILNTVGRYARRISIPVLAAGMLGLAGCGGGNESGMERSCDVVQRDQPSVNNYSNVKQRVERLSDDISSFKEHNEVMDEVKADLRKEEVENQLGEAFSTDKDSLYWEVSETLMDRNHTYRELGRPTYSEQLPEKEDIRTSELNVINSLLDGLQDPDVVNRVGRLMKKDLQEGEVTLCGVDKDGNDGKYTVVADKTELGGKILQADGQVHILPYEPIANSSDTGFVLEVSRTQNEDVLASFHLHAIDKEGNPEAAGPSDGKMADTKASESRNRTGIVFTYLGPVEEDGGQRIEFNADAVTPEGEVIDLGNYTTDVEAPDTSIFPF